MSPASSMTQLTQNVHVSPSPSRTVNRIPRTTYRLQLKSDFGFDQVRQLVNYLEQLGVSDLYLSPLFRARKDSSHGYDVVNHATVAAEFGGLDAFSAMAHGVRQRGMGILLDVVPNHMGINDPANRWWHDVLENGEMSRYARCFDIDWHRLPEYLRQKVLLPVLGDHFGHVLERGELCLAYQAGKFQVAYFENRFPITPRTWPAILRRALGHWDDAPGDDEQESPDRTELESIATQLVHLPPPDDPSQTAARERYREQAVASRRLKELVDRSPRVGRAVNRAVDELNGVPGDPRSFDDLEDILGDQWYRLAYWRVAADEINYRRFFDINDLAAIRVEDPEVFAAVHQLVEELLAKDEITGLRIDHPDGLLDPSAYFENLQKLFRRCRSDSPEGPSGSLYVVVEKILTGEEPLPSDWPVCGTTGYEVLNDINRVLVNGPGLERLRTEYEALVGVEDTPADIIYNSKRSVLDNAMASELNILAGDLHRVTQRHRVSRDFTFPALHRALRELIACFPVYRTYVPPRGWDVDDADYGRVMWAVRWAKRRNPTIARSVFDFLASVLLLQYPSGADEPDREEFRRFVMKFQQVTGPATAKGVEDTSFYRYYPLVSLNEVGGEIDAEPLGIDHFHRHMQHRQSDWPHGLTATATHDTKRGEDVRARLHVVSDVAEEWIQTVRQWQELNRPLLRKVGDRDVPDRNEEYLLYQTLVGTWPTQPIDDVQQSGYVERITGYMEKALREAKVNTSWANPVEEYEQAVRDFACELLDGGRSGGFLRQLNAFVCRIADAGYVNSLAQVVLKCTVPGVPDFYQGTELWDFHLVDPDNRRPVDYAVRQQWLVEMRERFEANPQALQHDLLAMWPDPRVKLWVVWRALQTRTQHEDVFEFGDYIPLSASGEQAEHLLAFARCYDGRWVVSAATPGCYELSRHGQQNRARQGPPPIAWGSTTIALPPGAPQRWKNALDMTDVYAESGGTGDGAYHLLAEHCLAPLPIAMLTSSNC